MNATKNYIFLIFIYIFSNLTFAQVTRVIYKNGMYDKNKLILTKEKNDQLGKFGVDFIEQMAKITEKIEFELLYDNKASIYAKIESLSQNENPAEKVLEMGFSDVYYKNIEKQEKLTQNKFTNGLTNIRKDFEEYKWIITTENKKINGYNCYKATSLKTAGFNPIKKTVLVFNITAWFTPDIPASFGPQGFDGLPGLVLEASENDKKYMYATKIEFNYKKEVKIEKPKCDKTVTEKEFEEILVENFKKMQDE